MFPGPVQASLHCGHAGREDRRDFGMTATLLDKGEEGTVLRAELGKGVAQGVEFLGVDGARGLGDVLVLGREGQEDAAELLTAQLVDAGVAREAEEPRLELRGRLQAVDGPHHLDEDLLGEVLDLVAAVGDREHEPGDAVLVRDDELMQRGLLAALRAANQLGEVCRGGFIHAAGIRPRGKTPGRPERYGVRRPTLPLPPPSPPLRPPFPMNHPVKTPSLPAAALLAVLSLAAGGCGSGPAPRDLMLEEAGRSASVERPVAMRGEGTFLGGSLASVATVTRGFDRGNRTPRGKGPGGGPVEGAFDDPSRRRRDDAGAFSEVYYIGGYGDSEEEQAQVEAQLQSLVGQILRLKVIEADRRRNRLILSERQANRELRSQRRDTLIQELEAGQVRRGRVSNVASFGVFVDLGGADGLVHISELSWARVKHPSEVVRPGQEVEVFVISVDRDSRKIALSLRRAAEDPWDRVDEDHPINSIVVGEVLKQAQFGVFVRLDEGIEGLVHSSEISPQDRRILQEGNRAAFRVISIERDRRRLRLVPIGEPGDSTD